MSITIPNPPGASGGEGASSREIAVQRRLTRAFINRLPVTVVLTPRSREKTPSGGTKWVDGTPRGPQVMTLIEMSTLAGSPEGIRTIDGVERRIEFEMVAETGSELARYDVFTHQGKDWEVIDLFYDNQYEVRALVSSRG
jgi:hypothetical protein